MFHIGSSDETKLHDKTNNKRTAALISAGIFGGLATGTLALALPFVWPAFRKIVLPYVPATATQLENVLQAVKHRQAHLNESVNNNNWRLIDLGSGDGRIVIECAKHGMRSHGVELNPWLVLYSKYQAYVQGVNKLATFQRKNLFKVDLAQYDKIIIFGVDSLMPLIEQKVRDDCNKTNKHVTVVACRFPLPHWQHFASFGSGIDKVWLYRYYPSNPLPSSNTSSTTT